MPQPSLADFPLPPDATPHEKPISDIDAVFILSFKQYQSGLGRDQQAVFDLPGSLKRDDIVDFYVRELEKMGGNTTVSVAQDYGVVEWKKGDLEAGIMFAKEPTGFWILLLGLGKSG